MSMSQESNFAPLLTSTVLLTSLILLFLDILRLFYIHKLTKLYLHYVNQVLYLVNEHNYPEWGYSDIFNE